MASTYSTLLRLELIGTGDQSGQWGITTNTNLGGLIEQAIAGGTPIVHNDLPDFVLTTNLGATDQARNMVLNIQGTLTDNRNVVCPNSSKVYVVLNNTTGGYSITLKTATGTGVEVPNGESRSAVITPSGVRIANVITANDIGGILSITKGGTGASTADQALSNLGGTDIGKAVFTAADIAGAQQALGVILNDVNGRSNNYTVDLTDRGQVIPVDASGGNLTMTQLPSVVAGEAFAIGFIRTDASTNTLTLVGDGGELINGAASFALSNQYDGVMLINWLGIGGWLAVPFGEFSSFLRPNMSQDITADIGPRELSLTDQATIQWNVQNGAAARVVIEADRAMGAPQNFVDGHTYQLVIEVGAGGGHAITSWDAVFKFSDAGEPVFPAAAGSIVIAGFISDKGSLLGTYARYPA